MNAILQHSKFSQLADQGNDKAELLKIIKERSFKTGEFTLSSGKQSSLYFDMKPTIMSPRGNRLAAREFLRICAALDAEYIGGLEMGAVPIIASVAGLSDEYGCPLRSVFVRKKEKAHGTKLKVEGLGPGEILEGRRVVMADDVTTSGGSVWQAIEVAQSAGAKIDTVISLVDREEGAAAFLADKGIKLIPVFSARDFLA